MNQDVFETKLTEVCDWLWIKPSRIGNKGRILKDKQCYEDEPLQIHIKEIYRTTNCELAIRQIEYEGTKFWYQRCETCKKIKTKSGAMVSHGSLSGTHAIQKIWDLYNK